ncbi:MAG: hypothetical protein O3A63_17600 [Proteobacteria bacterium]|nr:hypothetical protein [Pseudomonadota bacterium]
MTDAELLSIYMEYRESLFDIVTLLTTILFSYSVATYLAVERLTWPQLALLSAPFLGLMSSLVAGAAQTVRQIGAIETEILRRIEQASSGLAWLDSTVFSGDRVASGFLYFWIIVSVIAVGFAIMKKWRARAMPRTG